jgi:CRISPR-associated protein Csb2
MTVRDRAVARLKKALPENEALIDRVLIGRNATEADKAARVRIVPLPSIGHVHADREIRRILVEVPPNCPLPPMLVFERGFSGLHLGMNPETGEITDERRPILAPADDDGMLRHYGIAPSRPARVWRSVTPVALPQFAARRRIGPGNAGQKGADDRSEEENRAVCAVTQALRHAGVAAHVSTIRVQREPFAARGERAEAFAAGTRFAKERLWHVEITFMEPVPGPLILGDGRYLGLGLMAHTPEPLRDLITFTLKSDTAIAAGDRGALLRAVRRALMARARQDDGSVPRLFSGHESNGAAARSGRHEHVFLAAVDLDEDGCIERLVVAAPWRCDHAVRSHPTQANLFQQVVSSLAVVRAGRLGVIRLAADAPSTRAERLTGPARIWESHTCYRPTQSVRNGEAPEDVVLDDLAGECRRRGLPVPAIELLELADADALCVSARLRLRFAAAVAGPVLLGRDSHQGGGLFLVAGGDGHAAF